MTALTMRSLSELAPRNASFRKYKEVRLSFDSRTIFPRHLDQAGLGHFFEKISEYYVVCTESLAPSYFDQRMDVLV